MKRQAEAKAKAAEAKAAKAKGVVKDGEWKGDEFVQQSDALGPRVSRPPCTEPAVSDKSIMRNRRRQMRRRFFFWIF